MRNVADKSQNTHFIILNLCALGLLHIFTTYNQQMHHHHQGVLLLYLSYMPVTVQSIRTYMCRC